jgi:hypothetical protein
VSGFQAGKGTTEVAEKKKGKENWNNGIMRKAADILFF